MISPNRARLTLMIVSVVLLGGIGLVAYGELRPLAEPKFRGDLASVLPSAAEVPGWEIRAEEIADTPEMKRAVSEILNYDDAAFSSYIRGSDRISIYIAYWGPGKMPHRAVAGHTPDRCWVKAGWERAHARLEPGLAGPNGRKVVPAEAREMRMHSTPEWVLFWHMVGGERMSYGTELPPWHAPITDILTRGLNQREEQFFIRISSSHPVADWWTTVVVQTLIKRMRARNVPI